MTRRFVLERESRLFCDWLTELLNGTVSHGVRLECASQKDLQVVRVHARDRPVALNFRGRKASVYLALDYALKADGSGQFLMVEKSFIGLFRDSSVRELLLHYDYERGKGAGYPEAHMQVHASSEAWCDLTSRALGKLHLPVGGRRFRPTLEDLIEFLIVEELVEGRDGWERLIEKGRAGFRRIQLAALTRSDPTPAVEALRALNLMA